MTFLEAITWDYIAVVALSFGMVVSVIYYRLFISNNSLDNDDENDDRGGFNRDPVDPILDLPFGVVTIDELEKEQTLVEA